MEGFPTNSESELFWKPVQSTVPGCPHHSTVMLTSTENSKAPSAYSDITISPALLHNPGGT